ncbi:hypothetical protein BST61_g5452 [Cercospora zeina]
MSLISSRGREQGPRSVGYEQRLWRGRHSSFSFFNCPSSPADHVVAQLLADHHFLDWYQPEYRAGLPGAPPSIPAQQSAGRNRGNWPPYPSNISPNTTAVPESAPRITAERPSMQDRVFSMLQRGENDTGTDMQCGGLDKYATKSCTLWTAMKAFRRQS